MYAFMSRKDHHGKVTSTQPLSHLQRRPHSPCPRPQAPGPRSQAPDLRPHKARGKADIIMYLYFNHFHLPPSTATPHYYMHNLKQTVQKVTTKVIKKTQESDIWFWFGEIMNIGVKKTWHKIKDSLLLNVGKLYRTETGNPFIETPIVKTRHYHLTIYVLSQHCNPSLLARF